MDRSNLMLEKINIAIKQCNDAISSSDNAINTNRYNKLLERLEKLQIGVENDAIFTQVSDLSLIRMIYEHDPKGLWNAILEVNKVFRELYSSVINN